MARSRDSAENSILFYLNEIGKQEVNSSSRPANRQRALVVDGKTLTYLLDPRCIFQSIEFNFQLHHRIYFNLNFKL